MTNPLWFVRIVLAVTPMILFLVDRLRLGLSIFRLDKHPLEFLLLLVALRISTTPLGVLLVLFELRLESDQFFILLLTRNLMTLFQLLVLLFNLEH